jgi:hypothetical protein
MSGIPHTSMFQSTSVHPAVRLVVGIQGTLVGLLAAFSYELSILHAAARLTHADAFRTLHALYRERTHPLPPPPTVGPSASADGAHALPLHPPS